MGGYLVSLTGSPVNLSSSLSLAFFFSRLGSCYGRMCDAQLSAPCSFLPLECSSQLFLRGASIANHCFHRDEYGKTLIIMSHSSPLRNAPSACLETSINLEPSFLSRHGKTCIPIS